jgi:hypothetical protein
MKNRVFLPAFFALVAAACDANQTFLPGDAAYTTDAEPHLSCVPLLDGKISANELEPAIGASERFLVSPAGQTEQVNLDGMVDSTGRRVWSWSTSLASDRDFTLTPRTLAGKWYASSFSNGQFVLPIDAADTTEGVYVHTDQAVLFLGYASTEESPGKTLVVYESPVTLYQFPLQVGSSWTSSGTARNATLDGLPYAGTDTYQTEVDASGTMQLPDYTFTQALRVRTLVTLVPLAGETTTQRQVSFLAECFGEIARATSQLNETNPDFTVASEIRRLGATPTQSD